MTHKEHSHVKVCNDENCLSIPVTMVPATKKDKSPRDSVILSPGLLSFRVHGCAARLPSDQTSIAAEP